MKPIPHCLSILAALQLGAPLAAWTNQGALGGEFASREAKPIVDMAGGRKAVRFSGKHVLTASFPAPKSLRSVRLGGARPFSGALTRPQLFRRALSGEEISQLQTLWKREWQAPVPSPAAFAQKPTALWPTAAAMTAQRGQSDLGSVEYRFAETTGAPGASSSGWIPTPFFLDDGLQLNTRYAYTVAMRDPLGNVTAGSLPGEVVTDPKLRTSPDGQRWHDMPGSPVERKDMAGGPLQVGLYHASYGGDSSHITFTDFRLTTRP